MTAFRAVTFTFMYVVVNSAFDPGTTCGSKTSGACAEGEGAPLGGSTMLQHLATQSSQAASRAHEREGQEGEAEAGAALAALARVAKAHRAVRASLAELRRVEVLPVAARTPQSQALQLKLSKAREELRRAEEAAAEFSFPAEEPEPAEPALALAEESVGAGLGDPLDLKELALLAGSADDDVNLTADAMSALGWTPGVMVAVEVVIGEPVDPDDAHPPPPGPPPTVHRDHAWTFKKGSRCLATFAATNDMLDVQQVFHFEPMDFCGFSVHSGVAGELLGFMQSPEWTAFMEFLQGPDCETVTSVGHSLGGALASLFAAAANRGCEPLPFGSRRDFGLVTYAPFAVSKEPFWSGRKGAAFVGTRYSVAELDGGVSGSFALPTDTKPFRLAILSYLANLSATVQFPSKDFFAGEFLKAAGQDSEAIEATWSRVVAAAVPLEPLVRMNAFGPMPPFEFLHTTTLELIYGSIYSGFLAFSHDPVSSMMSYKGIGGEDGYKHPLVAFQPLANPLKAPGAPAMPRVSADAAPELPRGDFFQEQLGIIASGTALPNHQICCYATEPGCAQKFTVPWKECTFSPFR